MKRLALLLIASLGTMHYALCTPTADSLAICQMVTDLHARYSEMTLQDLYKTCYQDRFGAEHAVPDSVHAMDYLRYELTQLAPDSMRMPLLEPCGYRHRYERVSLQLVQQGEMTAEQVLSDFLRAARSVSEDDSDTLTWEEEWGIISRLALRLVPEWHDEELERGLCEASRGNRAVHHSSSFRAYYHPHYRLRSLLW